MSGTQNDPGVAHANTDDIPEILAMIKELADYENEPEKVLATENSLLHTLTFANTPGKAVHTNPGYAKTLILRTPVNPSARYISKYPNETPGAVAGMAIYFNNYSTWRSKPGVHLEDLFVRPHFRKRGWGRFLLQVLAQEVIRMDGGRLEWNCLKWNEPSLAFYKSIGAERMDDWVSLRVDEEELLNLAMGKPTVKKVVGQ